MSAIPGLLIMSCLVLLGASRLRVSIQMIAAQGIMLGLIPILRAASDGPDWFLGLGCLALKGLALPYLLLLALRRSSIRNEMEPFIGFNASIMIGIGLLGLSSRMAAHMQAAGGPHNSMALVAAIFMVFTGLFLIISRRKAITQALGYLVMENGIYCVGIGIGRELNAMVELGVMLDVFVGVFLMGIMIFHINKEFDHIDSDRFDELQDRCYLSDRPEALP